MYGVLKSVFVASALLLAAFASPNTAEARSFCAPRDNIVKILDKKFSEKRQAIGLANQSLQPFRPGRGQRACTSND